VKVVKDIGSNGGRLLRVPPWRVSSKE